MENVMSVYVEYVHLWFLILFLLCKIVNTFPSYRVNICIDYIYSS
jgi:hypothetical protein